MDLSRDAIRILRWMAKNDQWRYIEKAEKMCKRFDYRSFAALRDKGLVDIAVFAEDYENPEYDEYGNDCYPESCRISDAGKAYLEGLSSKRWPEIREWITICISVVALVVSFIALFL